jgi:hypothetical protein
MQKGIVLAAVLAAGWTAPVRAQELEGACAGVPAVHADRCVATAQAAASMQPALGIAIAGGNPTLGSTGAGGARLFGVPGLSASFRVNVTPIRIPDVTQENDATTPPPLTQSLTAVTVAVGGTVSMGITQGVGGVGAVDLLASGTYLPFDLVNREVYKTQSAQFAWGAGARVGLLRESATLPGVSVSVMRRQVGAVQIANVCEGDDLPDPTGTDTPPSTLCRSDGDVGDFNLDLAGWSTRAAVSKAVGPVGLAAGVGYDRYESEVGLDIRGGEIGAGQTGAQRIYHRPSRSLESSRWSAFLDVAARVPVGSIAAELGWMQGGDALPGFSADSDFDPGAGTFFGSLGFRLAL